MIKKILLFSCIFLPYLTFADYDRASILCNFSGSLPTYREKSEQIKEIQYFLKDKYSYAINISGKYDLQTKNSIKKFQYAFGLKPTGNFDTNTRKRIHNILECKKILEENYRNVNQSLNRTYFETESKKASTTTVGGISVTVMVKEENIEKPKKNFQQLQILNIDEVRKKVLDFLQIQYLDDKKTEITNNSISQTSQVTSSATSSNTVNFCYDRNNKKYEENEKVKDVCDTIYDDNSWKICISSRSAGNIPMTCKNGSWMETTENF